MRLLITLGGNAISQAHENETTVKQFLNCKKITRLLAQLLKQVETEDRLVITHGNGPQAGNLMVQQG